MVYVAASGADALPDTAFACRLPLAAGAGVCLHRKGLQAASGASFVAPLERSVQRGRRAGSSAAVAASCCCYCCSCDTLPLARMTQSSTRQTASGVPRRFFWRAPRHASGPSSSTSLCAAGAQRAAGENGRLMLCRCCQLLLLLLLRLLQLQCPWRAATQPLARPLARQWSLEHSLLRGAQNFFDSAF